MNTFGTLVNITPQKSFRMNHRGIETNNEFQ